MGNAMPDERPRLTPSQQRLLCRLADPEGEPLAADAFPVAEIEPVLHAARDHNVEPVVLRKIAGIGLSENAEFEHYRSSAVRDRMFLSAVTKALADQASRIARALGEAGVPHALIKGQAFAQELYPDPSDRPYSDIDILLPRAALARAGEIMQTLDFVQFKREHFDKSEANEEQKWGYGGDTSLLAELHTDIVHVPALRRRVSFGFDEYDLARGGGQWPAAGHFVVAVIHAAAGHKFHQLRLLVDVLQASRKLSDDSLRHLADTVSRLHIQPEVSMSLSLIDGLFPRALPEGRRKVIREALRLPPCWKIVTPQAVLEATGEGYWRSKFLRHAFRYYQMTLAPRRSLGV